MNEGHMGRRALAGLVAVGVVVLQWPSLAWAQLETVDPALHAAVEALIAHDPAVANDPELAELCRTVAEATVLDPAERAAVTSEVIALHREGVDLSTVIPTEVREAAREQWTQVQGQMREQLETLRTTDPQRAQEVELMMREGERCMLAFEAGEQYTPSPEMVAHAEGMMREWETEMLANGAPPEYIERARTEFAAWSSGEMTEVMGMMGPGHEMGGPGGMPTLEQMQVMVDAGQMTPEQLQMAKDYMQGGVEAYGAMEGFEHYGPTGGFEQYGATPMDAFETWASSPDAQNLDPATVDHMREMAETYQREWDGSVTSDRQADSTYVTPTPQVEVLVASHDHNNDGINDEFHYDTNGDGMEDHFHSTPH